MLVKEKMFEKVLKFFDAIFLASTLAIKLVFIKTLNIYHLFTLTIEIQGIECSLSSWKKYFFLI